jgi:V/A-type H+-transporting ATPase subunit F
MSKRVVAIAQTDNVFLFRSLGFDTFVINDEQQIKTIVDEVALNAQIIIIDEALQTTLDESRKRFSTKAFPILIALPIDRDASDQGLEKLRADVEKAIGLKLF